MNSRLLRVVLGLAIAIPGCSANATNGSTSADPSVPDGPGAAQDTGSVGLRLMLPAGQQIEVLAWTIAGPNGAATVVQTGTVDSQSLGVSIVVGNIPVGNGYRIDLSGTATDGSVTCTGSAPFNVAARTTTDVSLELACSVATAGAHVTLINGSSYNCAASSSVSASPTETTVGASVALSATAIGPVPGALTYAWSAPSGSFESAATATTNFKCTAAGPVSVTVTVGDGPVPAGASCSAALSTKTIPVLCDAVQVTPPPAAPAMPPLGLLATAAAMLGAGSLATRRRRRA